MSLCFYVASAATLVDMLASRTTDGALMVLTTAAIIVGCYWYDYDYWMAEEAHA